MCALLKMITITYQETILMAEKNMHWDTFKECQKRKTKTFIPPKLASHYPSILHVILHLPCIKQYHLSSEDFINDTYSGNRIFCAYQLQFEYSATASLWNLNCLRDTGFLITWALFFPGHPW